MKQSVKERYYTDVVISSGRLFAVAKKFDTHEILFFFTLTTLNLGEYKGSAEYDSSYTLRLNSVLPLSRLNGGRFKLYSEKSQQNSIIIRCSRFSPSEIFHDILTWINNNCDYTWSFKIELLNVNEFDLIFSFADGTEALLYQLRWQ